MIELLAWQRRALFFLNFLHRTRVLSTVAGRPSGRQGLLLWATPTAVQFCFFAIPTPRQFQRLPDCISVIGLVECFQLRTRTHRINRTRRPLSFNGDALAPRINQGKWWQPTC